MKTLACTLFGLLVLVAALPAAADPTTNTPSVTLAWDRPEDSSVTGYALYHGAATRLYTNRIPIVGADVLTCTVTNLERGVKYFFAVTSMAGAILESDYSLEVSYTTSPLPPKPVNLTITVKTP